MCLLYLIAIIIILLMFYKLINNNNNNNNNNSIFFKPKCFKSIEGNTTKSDFSNPKQMFLKVINDIKLSDKIVLNNVVSKCYMDKNTIEPSLNIKVNNILKDVISEMNKILNEDEYFIKGLEELYIIKDDKENFRLIISSFIYDIKNYYQIKFIMDVVFINGEYYLNFINIDERATNSLINRYDIRDIDHQATGLLLSYNMINEDLESILNEYYKQNNNILDFINNNNNNNNNKYNFMKISDLSKYYLPDGVPDLFSPMFCEKNSDNWGTDGVPFKNLNLPDTCISNNNAITKILNEPYDAPGVLYGDKTSEYSWLFNLFSNPATVAKDWTS